MLDRQLTIDTQHGPIVGRRSGSVRIFTGIPYAKPPIGPLRFRPPEPPDPWTSPRDATSFGPSPIQPAERMLGPIGPTSEDCLTLNVWAPTAPGPHPVLFWIYGGANVVGSSGQAIYDGATFAERGIVFVSANYRLGAFGCLELGPIVPDLSGSGLSGLRDLIAALRFVRTNIGAFAGDPNNVALMGESAGGKNVCALAASPAARGLFRRIAVQSGGGHTVFGSLDEAATVGTAFLSAAGLDRSRAQKLATMPAADLLAAEMTVMTRYPSGFPFRPTIDHEILPLRPIDAAIAGRTAHLEMVIGTCRDESALLLLPDRAEKPFVAQQAANLDLAGMETMERRYADAFPEMTIAERHIRQLSAEEYWIPSMRFAEAHVAAGGKAWMYRFDHAALAGPTKGYAAHGSDVPFIFKTPWLDPNVFASEANRALADRWHDFWVSWVRGDEPTVAGAPSWPAYDGRTRNTLTIDEASAIVADPRGDERRLWDSVL